MKNPYPKTEAQLLALLQKHNAGRPCDVLTARRFCAYVEALTNLDANSTRDWVDLFVEGFPGFKTTEHVDTWLDSAFDSDACNSPEEFDELIALIKQYLG